MANVYVGIMAGGAGTRFWPASRENKPKQFLDILGTGKTLLQSTFERFLKICPKEHIYIITNTKYAPLVLEQLPDITEKQIIKEPLRRNTAPCIAYAAQKILKQDKHANMVISPSDHFIEVEDKFIETINFALSESEKEDILITLGIQPTRPDTGYGYIQFIKENNGNSHIHKVKTFTEKPTLEIAKTFIQSGDFLWNSGIFIWNVKAINNAFQKYLPEIFDVFQAGARLYSTPNEAEFIQDAYALCTNISIDYGVMEKANNVYVIPGNFGWSDLGTWTSVHDKLPKNGSNNAVVGKNVMLYNAKDCMVNVPDDKLVVINGMEDFIVVESDDVLLITPKSDEQKIKQILRDIKESKGEWFL